MTIEWDGYEPYEPDVAGPPDTLPRVAARQAFKRCMETKSARLEMLSRLLKANGVEPGNSDAAVQDLNDWFFAHVEADPEQPGRLLPDWYSVVHDVALFLGDVMIERHPNLRWEFFTWGKTNVVLPAARDHGLQHRGSEVPHEHQHRSHGRHLRPRDHRARWLDPKLRDGRSAGHADRRRRGRRATP